jgi:hypothetical protein
MAASRLSSMANPLERSMDATEFEEPDYSACPGSGRTVTRSAPRGGHACAAYHVQFAA